MGELHRRLAALLALVALLAFVSGAGLAAPSVLPALLILSLGVIARPALAAHALFEPVWRAAALLLAARAGVLILLGQGDPVLPMVDLLLLLLCAESLRDRDGGGDARHFALTFALLIASAAYRPGPLFGVLFAAYVCVGVLVLVLGHLSREARSARRSLPAPAPSFLFRIAGASAIVLLASAVVFLFFPRVAQGWASRGTPPVARAIVGFSDRVSIGEHGTRIEGNPEVVLRIEFPAGPPGDLTSLHWRGRGYTRFDGSSWTRGDRVLFRGPREADHWPGPLIEQVIYARTLPDANVLFGLHAIHEVRAMSRIQPVRARNGDYLYIGDGEPVYRVRSRVTAPDADALRNAPREYPPEVMNHLQVPALSSRIIALADSFRREAPTIYDQARAVEAFLRSEFAYTLDLPASRREATLDHFLFVRRAGHCEYFSTAMAILLRAGGVPTRNVNGFLGGEWNEFGRYLTVTQNNAHSWVEVYFPGHGWVTFDPTPASAVATIARGADALGPLQRLLDGVDHRWGKWIIGYDAGRQSELLQRVASTARGLATLQSEDVRGRVLWVMLIGVAVALLLLRLRRRRRAETVPGAARAYYAMRQAYQRAGFPPARALPPLAFAAAVADAPGGATAQRVVHAYLRARFARSGLSAEDAARMDADARAARDAILRAARHDTVDLSQPAGR